MTMHVDPKLHLQIEELLNSGEQSEINYFAALGIINYLAEDLGNIGSTGKQWVPVQHLEMVKLIKE